MHKIVLTASRQHWCGDRQWVELSVIDVAILDGHYQIAQYIYNSRYYSRCIKTVQEYAHIGKIFQYRYVDYDLLVNALVSGISAQEIQHMHTIYRPKGKHQQMIALLWHKINNNNNNSKNGQMQMQKQMNMNMQMNMKMKEFEYMDGYDGQIQVQTGRNLYDNGYSQQSHN